MKVFWRIALLTLAIALIFSLGSCRSKENGNDGEANVIFSPSVDVSIVVHAGEKFEGMNDLIEAIYDLTGDVPPFKNDGIDKTSNEIVFGDTTREVSVNAKKALEKRMEKVLRNFEDDGKDTTFVEGYAIYAEGGSVAIVWTDVVAFSDAFEFFVKNYLIGEKLVLDEKYIKVQIYDRIEGMRAEEAKERAELYKEIEADYGADVVKALQNHLSMFDERYYLWLADLYDAGEYDDEGNPLGGGFYYSNSGRDTPGYAKDLESTMQALSWITGSSGMFSGKADAREKLPASMLDELAAFALSCQSSTDGYFYHPQWGDSIGTSRLGRDLSWATQILDYAQVKPYWNTPNNTSGFYGEPDEDDTKKDMPISEYRAILATTPSTTSSLPDRLSCGSSVSAVSKVIPAAKKWNGSDWLSTLEKWEAYLKSYESTIHTKSYSIGNNFSAQSGQINTRDKLGLENGEFVDVRDVYGNSKADGIADGGFVETWGRYFDSWQYDYNGLWEHNKVVVGYDKDGNVITEDDPNGDPYYNAINGLMKISSCYDSLKLPFNHAEEAFKCAVYMATYFGTGESTGNDGTDWKDVNGKAPTNSVDVYNPWVAMSHIISIVNRTDKDQAAALRQITKDNALGMIEATTKKVSKFAKNDGSYGYSWSYSPANSQGAPVAVPNTVEGDINGGNIAFTGTFGTMRGVLGLPGELKPFAPSDGLIFAERIKNLSPIVKDDESLLSAETGERNFDDDQVGTDKPEDVNLSFNKGSAVVVADPEVQGNKYLKFNAVPGDSGNTLSFNAKQEKGATGVAFEWKMKFEDPIPQNNRTAFQISLGSAYMLTLAIYTNGTFKIGDSSSTGSPNITNLFDPTIDAYEWNKIRVEFYILDAEQRSTVTQIYVNDELRAVSTNYLAKEKDAAPTLTYKSIKFFALKAANVSLYLDDMKAMQIKTPYVEKPVYNPDLVKDFDKVEPGSGKLPNGVTTTGGEVVSEPTAEKPDNNIFVLNAKDETVNIGVSNSALSPNCYAATTKMKIGSGTTGDIGVIYLSGGSAAKAMMAYRINVYDEGGTKYAQLTEYNKEGKSGKTFKGLPTDVWFALTIEFYPYFYTSDVCTILYLGDEELGRGNTYYHIGTLSATYTYLTVTMSADATISLDDVQPESMSKKFISAEGVELDDPDIKLPTSGKGSSTAATSDHNGKFDFEGVELGNPKVPGLTTSVNTNEYGYWLDIAKDPTNEANQVLSHIVVPSQSYGNTQTYTASKLSPEGANCHVLEFDVLIANGVAGQLQTSFNGKIVGSNGKENSVKMFQTNTNFRGKYTENTATVQITSKRDVKESLGSYTNTSASADVSKSGGEIIKTRSANGWLNIRFELYTDQGKVQIYYDGVYVGETDLVYNNQMKANFTTATIYTVYGANQELYFDNVVVESIIKEYVAQTAPTPDPTPTPDPDTPTVPEGFDGTYDFDGETVGDVDMYGITVSLNGGGHAQITADPRSATGKALNFKTIKGTNSNYNEHVEFAAYKVSDAKKFVVEWEMKFDEIIGTGESIQFNLGSAYMMNFIINGDKQTFSIGDLSSTSGADSWYVAQTLKSNITASEWHSFKVEYAVVGDNAMIKVYLDTELIAVSDNHYGEAVSAMNSSSKFGMIRFRSNQGGGFTAYLDNVKAYTTTEVLVPAEYTKSVHGLIGGSDSGSDGGDETVDPYAEPTIIAGSVSDFDTTDNIKKDTASPIATYTVVDDPLVSGNKVLEVAQTNNSQTYDVNTVATYNLSEAKSTGVYELAFDMYLDAKIPTNKITILQFVLNSETGYAMLFSFEYKADGTFRISQDRKDSSSGVAVDLASSQILADAKWHNIRFVIEYAGTDSYVSLYVDGNRVARKATYFYNTAVTDGTPIKSATWRVCDNKTKISSVDTVVMDYYKMYIDDMYLVYVPDKAE